MRVCKTAAGAATLVSIVLSSSIAMAGGTPAGGTVRFYVTPTTGTKSKVLVTGAIGDFGTAVSIDKNGKPNVNGNYEKVNLKHGSFEINATGFEKSVQHAQPKLNNDTCTVDLSGHGSGSLLAGTGLYKGISGKLKISFVLGGLAPRFTSGPKKGSCNLTKNGPALDLYQSIIGTGTVAFS